MTERSYLEHLKQKTSLSRPPVADLTQPIRKEAGGLGGGSSFRHGVIVQFTGNPSDPFNDDSRSFVVGLIQTLNSFPVGGYRFQLDAENALNTVTAFAEPDLRARHYAHWLWRGNLAETFPNFISRMRVLRLYEAGGYVYAEWSARPIYTQLTAGAVPSDCPVNQV